MNRSRTTHTSMAAAASLFVGGVLQLTDEQSAESTVVGVEHVTIGAFSASLLLLIPLVLHLGRHAGRARAAHVAVTGQAVLAVTAIISNVRGEDLAIFPALAAPSNLAILGGLAVIGVALRRRTGAPLALAAGLPLSWAATLVLAPVGGGILAAAYVMAVTVLLVQTPAERLAAA